MFFIILVCIHTEVRKRLKNSFCLFPISHNYLAFLSSLQMTERFQIIMLVLFTSLLPADLIDAGEKLLFKLVSSLLDYIRFIMIFVIYIMLCFLNSC